MSGELGLVGQNGNALTLGASTEEELTRIELRDANTGAAVAALLDKRQLRMLALQVDFCLRTALDAPRPKEETATDENEVAT